MVPYAREAAAACGIAPDDLRFVTGSVEAAPFADASFDYVISTLVLCSVPSQAAALHEIKRVLRPGGRFVFIEHVVSPTPGLRKVQEIFDPLQQLVAQCHLTRDTGRAIHEAGFTDVQLREISVEGAAFIAPHIVGLATL